MVVVTSALVVTASCRMAVRSAKAKEAMTDISTVTLHGMGVFCFKLANFQRLQAEPARVASLAVGNFRTYMLYN